MKTRRTKMELPKGYEFETHTNMKRTYDRYSAIIFDPKETVCSHIYKSGWWTAPTMEEAKQKAIKEMEARDGHIR